MDTLNRDTVGQHVTILGWLMIISNALFLVIGAFVFMLLTGIGAVSGDFDAVRILTLIGTLVGGLLTVLGLPGILAGYGLLKRAAWGRILALVVAFLGLLNFPVGTAVGLYALWVLLQTAASDYFNAPAWA